MMSSNFWPISRLGPGKGGIVRLCNASLNKGQKVIRCKSPCCIILRNASPRTFLLRRAAIRSDLDLSEPPDLLGSLPKR